MSSYIARLAAANHCDRRYLSALLTFGPLRMGPFRLVRLKALAALS